MTTNGNLPPLDAWQAETMRVTVFPTEVVPVEPSVWWDEVVGVPPETVVARPKVGQFQARGDFEGRQLILQVQPGRVEWILGPLAKAADDEESVLPSLGPFPEVLQSLSKVVVPWLPQAPALQRFAFGAIVMQPVNTVHAGYALLQKYLGSYVRLDPESSDFFYQINRRRPSRTIAALHLNRLTKWSVQTVRRMTMTLGAEGGAVTRALGEDAACRLELDINTAPDFAGVLPAEQLTALLKELTDLGREIAQRGDIP
jgi:hypothetical protein